MEHLSTRRHPPGAEVHGPQAAEEVELGGGGALDAGNDLPGTCERTPRLVDAAPVELDLRRPEHRSRTPDRIVAGHLECPPYLAFGALEVARLVPQRAEQAMDERQNRGRPGTLEGPRLRKGLLGDLLCAAQVGSPERVPPGDQGTYAIHALRLGRSGLEVLGSHTLRRLVQGARHRRHGAFSIRTGPLIVRAHAGPRSRARTETREIWRLPPRHVAVARLSDLTGP